MNSESKNNDTEHSVNAKLMVMITIVLVVISYALGYAVSVKTGVEPGFFEIAESGGYGVAADNKPVEGMSEDLQDYYNQLSSEE